MRVKAIIAYDGSEFFGFQKQKSTPKTVAGAIERALLSLQIKSVIVGSGRTDAGVHASGQVIHFDVPNFWHDMEKLKLNLNRKLKSIFIKHISLVAKDFHARFWATKRLYRYIFKTTTPSVFEQKYISYYPDFDEVRLKKGLSFFKGVHDFNYFHKTGSILHSTQREIYNAQYKALNGYHIIYFEANGFLRAQVRMMIDAAMRYAKEELTQNQLKNQIANKERYTTNLAPPHGLYLAHIYYKES